MHEWSTQNIPPLLLSRYCNVYMKYICVAGQYNEGDSLWLTCYVHALHSALDWPVTSPSIHPLRGVIFFFRNISLHNAKQELIELLIFYHSFAWATPPQVAVQSLRLLIHCCFDGWCLYWLADLSGLLGFCVTSIVQGIETNHARHRKSVLLKWLADFIS